MPDSGALFLALGDEASARGLIEETIDRRLDGAELEQSLAALLAHTGAIDFLYASYADTEGSQLRFSAGAGTMNEGDTSNLYLYVEFAEAYQAEEAESQMTGQNLYGYSSGGQYRITEIAREGTVVVAQAEVPDIDVEGLLLGN